MDFFRPTLSDNQPIKFPLQFYGYGYNFVFPLSSQAGWFQHLLKKFGFLLSCSFYCTSLFHEFTWMSQNISNIAGMVDCLATVFAGGQFLVRLLVFINKEKVFKNLLTRFYAEIYYDERKIKPNELEFLKPLRMHEIVIDYFTKFYLSPGIFFIINFTVDGLHYNIRDRNKPYIYQMSFPFYDAQQPVAYVITGIYSSWLSWSVVQMMMTGDYILCTVLLHLAYRYKALRKRTENLFQTAQKFSKNEFELQQHFRKDLYDIIKKQQDLQRFMDEARGYFTYQIFIGLLCGIFLTCLVLFLLRGTPMSMDFIKYVTWLIIQVMQIVGIGYYGQMLSDETSGMQDSFFSSQWEKLLPYGDTHTNQVLMMDIKFAILNAQKPVVFDGLKMFVLTHQTIGMSLRSAMSYFMFINTMDALNLEPDIPIENNSE